MYFKTATKREKVDTVTELQDLNGDLCKDIPSFKICAANENFSLLLGDCIL